MMLSISVSPRSTVSLATPVVLEPFRALMVLSRLSKMLSSLAASRMVNESPSAGEPATAIDRPLPGMVMDCPLTKAAGAPSDVPS